MKKYLLNPSGMFITGLVLGIIIKLLDVTFAGVHKKDTILLNSV